MEYCFFIVLVIGLFEQSSCSYHCLGSQKVTSIQTEYYFLQLLFGFTILK